LYRIAFKNPWKTVPTELRHAQRLSILGSGCPIALGQIAILMMEVEMDGAGASPSAERASKKIHIPCFPLEAMRTPSFLVDRSLRVVKANSRAENLIAGIQPPATINDGMLRLGCQLAHGELGSFVDGFLGSDAEDQSRFVRPNMLLRLLRSEDKEVVLLSLRLASHQLRQVTAAGVAMTFGLSVMQSRLVVALVNAHSVDDFARSASIKQRTGKHHLSLLLKKFECSSQTELVRKLCILML
jgi:DNA-binding CsgD family transcriptional regulator